MNQDNTKFSFINILKVIGTVIGSLVIIFGVYSYIDLRIDQKISNPAFIEKIASNVRPSVIFDSQESIEIDMGAMQFIENIKVTPSGDSRFPKEITISPKKYLAHAPFLSSLDEVVFQTKVARGKKYDWVYQLTVISYNDRVKKSRFRLEILK